MATSSTDLYSQGEVANESTQHQTKGAHLDNCRFNIADEANWLAHLKNEGFAIIRACADSAEVEHARSLLWDALELATPARRNNLESWDSWRLDRRGFTMHGTVTQGEGAWFVRALPSLHRAFACIWRTERLICSMDALLIWRPWWRTATPSRWQPKTEGLHVDQNPLFKAGFECVQGMVPLYDVTAETGGLEVVPRSHLPAAKERLIAAMGGVELQKLGDFCRTPADHYAPSACALVVASAGDLILWDSRTVHGGRVGSGATLQSTSAAAEVGPQLSRLTLPVCMTPRDRASDEVLMARRKMFAEGKTTNHWPHEPRVQNHVSLGYAPIQLSPAQEALL